MRGNGKVVTPLRYPGGKSRALETITRHAPSDFAVYREPFVGGGSVFLHFRQLCPDREFWINDLNSELYSLWIELQRDGEQVASEVERIKRSTNDGKQLFQDLKSQDTSRLTPLERAVRFFVLNRIGFSGTVEAGGYSQGAYEGRFTNSAIQRLRAVTPLLAGVRITNLDYHDLIELPGDNVFLFLDPPYFSATKSRLYGKNGTLHTTFNHEAFAECVQKCPHQWLITYDNSPYIRALFPSAQFHEWTLQYGMNNYKQGRAAAGREVFIRNYEPAGEIGTQLPLW